MIIDILIFMFCKECGAEIPDDSKHCKECGAKITPNTKHCKECGTEIPDDSKHCKECGAKIADKPSKEVNAQKKKDIIDDSNRKYIIVCCIGLIVIFLLVGVATIPNNTSKTNDKKESINWNVSKGLQKTSEVDICTSYEDGDYKFRIVSANDSELPKYKNGFEKDNDTGIYKRYDVDAEKLEHSDGVAGMSNMLFGEYVKIGDKHYWVEALHQSSGVGEKKDVVNNLTSTDLEKLRGYLTYFNEHNNATIIDM